MFMIELELNLEDFKERNWTNCGFVNKQYGFDISRIISCAGTVSIKRPVPAPEEYII